MKSVFLALVAFSSTVFSQEQCGFPVSLARSGFESGEQPASVVLPPENTPLSITIQGPISGSTVGVDAIQIYGTYVGPANTGVSINGVPALTNGSAFVSPRIPLEPGLNTLTIRYASTDTAAVTQTRTVTYSAAAQPAVVFAARSPGDYAPTTVPFVLATTLPPNQTVVARVQIDYNGDGIFEVDGLTPPARLEFAYENPGLYPARARVSFDDGNIGTPLVVQEDTARVLIQSLAYTRQTLCGVYYAMKSRLQQNQISLALNTQSPKQRNRMQALWTGLANNSALVTTANRLGQIIGGQLSRNTAEMTIAIPTATAGQYDGFSVRFRRDENGVWRIDFM